MRTCRRVCRPAAIGTTVVHHLSIHRMKGNTVNLSASWHIPWRMVFTSLAIICTVCYTACQPSHAVALVDLFFLAVHILAIH